MYNIYGIFINTIIERIKFSSNFSDRYLKILDTPTLKTHYEDEKFYDCAIVEKIFTHIKENFTSMSFDPKIRQLGELVAHKISRTKGNLVFSDAMQALQVENDIYISVHRGVTKRKITKINENNIEIVTMSPYYPEFLAGVFVGYLKRAGYKNLEQRIIKYTFTGKYDCVFNLKLYK